MNLAAVELIVGVSALAWFGALVWSLVVVLRTPADVWEAAGMNQIVWLMVVVFLPLLGVALFATIARPRLTAQSHFADVAL